MDALLASLRRPAFWLVVVAILVASIFPYMTGSDLNRETIFLVFMFVTLASSLNILLGYSGYVNFGNVVFFGLGGYIGFYLIKSGWQLVPASLIAAASVTLFALLIGGAVLRLRGAYFALVTIGVSEVLRSLITNIGPLGASTGMSLDLSVYNAYGGINRALWIAYGYIAVVTLLAVTVSFVLRRSKIGLGLLAIREDEDAAEVLGVDTARYKLVAFALSAFFPAIVGTIFFFKNNNIEPAEAFELRTSIETIVMVMLGGAGTVMGPLVGAAGYERLRSSLITAPGVLRELQLFFAGTVLLIVVLFVPEGLVGYLRRRFDKTRAVLE